jgi:hypothetical protein
MLAEYLWEASMSKPPNRNWIWFFVVLAILGIAAISISWIYNVKQQLTPAELTRNRELWETHRPRDYVFEYLKRLGDAEEVYTVTVRGGRVQSVVMKPKGSAEEIALRPDQYGSYDMSGQFDQIERFLELDREPGARRSYNRATFDPQDGHLLSYDHSRGSASKSVKIIVTRFDSIAHD